MLAAPLPVLSRGEGKGEGQLQRRQKAARRRSPAAQSHFFSNDGPSPDNASSSRESPNAASRAAWSTLPR